MDRSPADPTIEFALRILREHPQISYEHAVSAAEYSGVAKPTRATFRTAARRLGLDRTDLGADAPSESDLTERIEGLRVQVRETAEMREALLRIRHVVRAALEEG